MIIIKPDARLPDELEQYVVSFEEKVENREYYFVWEMYNKKRKKFELWVEKFPIGSYDYSFSARGGYILHQIDPKKDAPRKEEV